MHIRRLTPCAPFGWSSETPFKMWFINEQGFMTPVVTMTGTRESFNCPRQKLPLVYWQDGYVDITKEETLLKKNSTTGDLDLALSY